MARSRTNPNERYVNSIQCPVDLDSIIMSPNCTPELVEGELNIANDIMYDAIKLCVNSSWLLKLDVFSKFTKEFRTRLIENVDAFPRMASTYLGIKANVCNDEGLGHWEFSCNNGEDVLELGRTRMLNPFTMLGNDMVDSDRMILDGEVSLRETLLTRIQSFLKDGNKATVDFSYSLFLPELLSPKFFDGLSEAEQVVILCTMEKYFAFARKFSTSSFGLRSASLRTKELNPPLCIIRHVLSSENSFTDRVRLIAWRQLFNEIDRQRKSNRRKDSVYDMFDMDETERRFRLSKEKLDEQGYSSDNLHDWADNANGLFEAFELDCTLHNVNAIDFFIPMLCAEEYYKMTDGLIDFQDVKDRNALFDVLSKCLTDFK